MPRAIDPSLAGGGLPVSNDPLNNIGFNVIPQDLDFAEILQSVIDTLVDSITTYLFPAIEQLTGIDLSILLPLLDVLNLDFSTPEAFLASLVNVILAIPEILLTIVSALVNELLSGVSGLLGDLGGGLLGGNFGFASIADIFESITGSEFFGTDFLEALTFALTNIPFLNILGIGGPATGADTVQTTWDQLISGFVGAVGTGAGLADLFNISQDVSSRATLGRFSWDILGIRSNKSLMTGLLSTSESNIGLDKVGLAGSAPTFALTQSTAITAFQRISESASKGVVSWLGSGVTNVTHAFVNIYQMNTTTGAMTLVHESGNINGSLGSAMQYNVYEVVPPIAVAPGEVYGIELAIRGAGTHSVVGSSTWLPDHPTVFPKRLSAVRNSGTSAAPSTISSGSVAYTSNVPFMEFGVSAGDVGLPHSPQTIYFGTLGTLTIPIPTWVDNVEVITLGGAGGGSAGGALRSGNGGHPGVFSTATWLRGADFAGATSVTINVGAGGTGGSGDGSTGTATAASVPGHTVTAAAGAGGVGSVFPDNTGIGAGNVTYGGQVYVGGGNQNVDGATGAAPGGGGAGGGIGLFAPGGNGASGGVWLRFLDTGVPPAPGSDGFPYTFPFPLDGPGPAPGPTLRPLATAPAGNGRFAFRLFGGSDDPSRLPADKTKYQLFMISPYHTAMAAAIRSANPTAVILFYKDASSMRRHLADAASIWCPADGGTIGKDWGVQYCDSLTNHPTWFMTIGGNKFEYNGYADHWHADPGATGYKERWVTNVTADLTAHAAFDGVLIDNQLTKIRAYTTGGVYPDQYSTDAAGLAAYDTYIDYVGAQLTGAGKHVIANMADARLTAGLWDDFTEQQSGGFDEMWLSFGDSGGGVPNNLPEYAEGWSRQMDELASTIAANQIGVFSTQSTGLLECAKYGYASFLAGTDGTQCFMESNFDIDGQDYVALGTRPMYSWQLGAPTEARVQVLTNLWRRRFANGVVWVNSDATTNRTGVSLGGTYTDESGASVSTITVDAMRARILRS